MSRSNAVLMVLLLVVGTLSASPAAALASTSVQEENETVTPGERLAGVVGAQDAELEGEIETRAFDVALSKADTDEAKADVVAKNLEQTKQRLAELEERKTTLKQARENGSISTGEYRASVTKLAVQAQTTNRSLQQSENATERLPAALLQEKGINATAIMTLRMNASELSGGEVAAIARQIAGPNVASERGARGGGADGQSAENASKAIARAEQAVSDAREQLDQTRDQINESETNETVTAELEYAQEQLTAAEEALQRARNASAAGDEQRAIAYATQAQEQADSMTDRTEKARDTARNGAGEGDRSDGADREQGRESGDGTQSSGDSSGDDGTTTTSDSSSGNDSGQQTSTDGTR